MAKNEIMNQTRVYFTCPNLDFMFSENKLTTKVVLQVIAFPAVNPVDKCTLEAAVNASIGGSNYCLNSLGESTYSTAEAKCRSRNAKLPMPRSSQENSDFMKALSKLGLNPSHDTGNPVILGMVDSAVGSVIGNYFALDMSAVILKFRGLV